jgi:hypothetical protein
MAKSSRASSGTLKRGGYTGGSPAASVKPPAKVPSGAIKASKSDGSSPKK